MINAGFVGAEEGVRFRYPRIFAQVLAAEPHQRRLEIVDLGSAAGTIGSWLVGRDPRFSVTGVDLDPHLVADANLIADRGSGAIHYVQGDVTRRLPFDDGSVDGVVLHRLRDSIVDRGDRTSLTAEIARIVRLGGLVSLLEDMLVFPSEREGAWYAERYQIHRRILELLLEQGRPGLDAYATWLADPDAALLMSLRSPGGSKVDDTAWLGNEHELAEQIAGGLVRLRGIGIHQTVKRVQADFRSHGLQVRRRWRVGIPEPAPRLGHATVMKGLLFRRVDPPAA